MSKKILQYTAIAASLLTCLTPNIAQADMGEGWFDLDRFQFRGRIISVIADGSGTVDGTALETDVSASETLEFDVSYFFTKNIAAELIAATSKHTVQAGTSNLGNAWILPPTVTLQYHFTPEEKFSPYLGAGLNYSMFYGEDSAAGFSELDVEGGVGYAVQAGFDYWIDEHWGINMDVKYIDLDVDVDVVSGGTTALRASNVDLNPVVAGVGVSYRF